MDIMSVINLRKNKKNTVKLKETTRGSFTYPSKWERKAEGVLVKMSDSCQRGGLTKQGIRGNTTLPLT